MPPRSAPPLAPLLTLLAAALVAVGLVAGAGVGPDARAQEEPAARIWLPLVLRNAEGELPAVPTADVTPGPSPTASATPEPSATPTATTDPRRADYPRGPGTIVLQVGRSETEQPGEAWEEMNGTPYFTLYGDGRLIAYQLLFGTETALYGTRLSEAEIQAILVPLYYDAQIFGLRPSYEHPDFSRYAAHLYLRFGEEEDAETRVALYGYTRWLRDPLPDLEDAARVRIVADTIDALEAHTAGLSEPYAPEAWTIIAHEIYGSGQAPRWPLSLDVKAISDRAPLRPGEGHPHGPPGHDAADAATGAEVSALTTEDARRDYPGFNPAARYTVRGSSNYVVVGARAEVPGGTKFLPDRVYDRWYRRDR